MCFGTDEDIELEWLAPCKCRGTAKWVHTRCLQRWIDEKHKHNPDAEVHCPQCNHLYKIKYPQMGTFFAKFKVIASTIFILVLPLTSFYFDDTLKKY